MSALSEVEDDPDVSESSGEEWDNAEEKKRTSRRSSQRLSKKPRISLEVAESSDSDIEEQPKPRSKNGVNKKRKISPPPKSTSIQNSKRFLPKIVYSDDFSTGSFVILKKDAQVGDPSKHPCIWRIDGKALLQKYEAFSDNDKVMHKNTSIYTGWSPLDKDLYAPVTVDVLEQSNVQTVVELHWDKLKEINMDSD